MNRYVQHIVARSMVEMNAKCLEAQRRKPLSCKGVETGAPSRKASCKG